VTEQSSEKDDLRKQKDRDRKRADRAEKRKRGLRPYEIWVEPEKWQKVKRYLEYLSHSA